MKNFLQGDFKKSKQTTNKIVSFTGVKAILATLFLTAFIMVSCSKDDQQDIKTEEASTDTFNPAARRYEFPFIVRAWGSHNIDCSQPNGFCLDVWTIIRTFYKPLPTGTPVKAANINGAFVMKFYKSALTEEDKATLLRNGNSFNIPEGQIIPDELVEALGFSSNSLRAGNYRIQENDELYGIAIAVN
ncbi:hypothetical protein GGR22_000594 [Flavobacterium gossypii]|uniref:Uncharacterized protein n=1 Tax=Flavobacterium gossypii TaxID=1646119 RepID=A0ABR6DL98_9FLAO|nr:hypothetical protein [Flavobacterium gossypii]MBA9072468.1 hypothetical protein [Flavobacterium gossypii]